MTADDRRRHKLPHLEAEYGGTVTRDRIEEIALRENADRLHPLILDDNCADTMFSEPRHSECHGVGRPHLHDAAAFDFQHIGDEHLLRPPHAILGGRDGWAADTILLNIGLDFVHLQRAYICTTELREKVAPCGFSPMRRMCSLGK